jgi:hypothetical protein
LEHVPARLLVVALQVLHRSVQAALQHTPSVQTPLLHWTGSVHAEPFSFKPQDPFAQVAGATQSALLAHVFLHAPAAQVKEPHD